jgi:hypothetical protein
MGFSRANNPGVNGRNEIEGPFSSGGFDQLDIALEFDKVCHTDVPPISF